MAIAIEHYGLGDNEQEPDFVPFHQNHFRGITVAEAAALDQQAVEAMAVTPEAAAEHIDGRDSVVAVHGLREVSEQILN